jgi:hypothetical protein
VWPGSDLPSIQNDTILNHSLSQNLKLIENYEFDKLKLLVLIELKRVLQINEFITYFQIQSPSIIGTTYITKGRAIFIFSCKAM